MYKKIFEPNKSALIYIKFTLLIALGYFPMWSFLMGIKNDALNLSYPTFYFFANQLSNGHIPWWHFNIHLGFPLHADPGFTFWNPIIWLWTLIAGKSIYSYTLLIFLHAYAGGIGMIKLSKWFNFSPPVQLVLGLAFPLSGFFSAHLQHPHYIFEAACIPFVILYFLRVIYQPVLKNAALFAISIFFLINSGYPSFTIGTIYFLSLLLVFILLSNLLSKKRQSLTVFQPGKIFIMLGLSSLLIVILCLPYIYSFVQFYPYFNRSSAVIQEHTGSGGITIRSLLSLVFPLSSVADPVFFGTDRSWSNLYVGLGLLLFCIYSCFSVKHPLKCSFIAAGLFMLTASMQGAVKEVFFDTLPFFNRMHSNGGLRIYFILSILIIGGMGFEKFLNNTNNIHVKKILTICLLFLVGISFLTFLLPGTYSFHLNQEMLKNIPVKTGIFIQAVISIFFTIILLIAIRNKAWFSSILISEIIIAFFITLPYTALSIHKTRTIEENLSAIRASSYQDDIRLHFDNHDNKNIFFKEPNIFNDHISTIKSSAYPSAIKQYFSFLSGSYPEKINAFRPAFSIKDIDNDSLQPVISKLQITGEGLSLTAKILREKDTLVITQNHYPNWIYHVNGQTTSEIKVWDTFIGFPLSKGDYTVKGIYRPTGVIISFLISIFAWVILFIILYKKKYNN